MKRFFSLTFAVLQFIVFRVDAIPAYPYPVQYQQPDGSILTIVLKGDERVHWATSADDYTLLLNKTGFYEYAQQTLSGDLKLSGIRASEPDKRSRNESLFLKNTTKNVRYSREQVNLLKQVWASKETALASIAEGLRNGTRKSTAVNGAVRAPLILVQFPGKSFTKSKQDFEMLTNQPDYRSTPDGSITGSVRDYFYDNSYGQLEFQVDVYGPYTMAHNIAYYDHSSSGGNPAIMTREAVRAADADGCDFRDYDLDGDGYVDVLHVVFAGYGQEAGAPVGNSIWSHASKTYDERDGRPYPLLVDSKIVFNYSCSPELRESSGGRISHIGVITHELSHIFGLPDFYDTDYGDHGQAIDTGEWDIMAKGSWNDRGRTPAGHNAWSKNYLGWVPAVELSAKADVTLPNPAQQGAVYRVNTTTPGEYFLLENRQRQGWDAYIPSNGMLIYHVDQNANWSDNCLNCNPSHRGLYVKQAGGGAGSDYANRTTDPYPSAGNTEFTDTSVPDSKSWAGAFTNKPITAITQNTADRTVSFQFMYLPDYSDASLEQFIDLPAVDYFTGEKDIKVELGNQGAPLTAATIDWTVDGQAQTPFQWTGSLSNGQKDTLTIGRVNLAPGEHTFSASVTANGDENAGNNTITTRVEMKTPETLFHVPFAEDFESGASGWTTLNSADADQWYVGSATAASGTLSAYISGDGGTTNHSTANQDPVYLFCDIFLTPYSTRGYYQLGFDWKGGSVDASLTVLTAATGTESVDDMIRLGEFGAADTWKKAHIDLPDWQTVYAGNLRRLLFMWKNSSGSSLQPAIAIDNVAVRYVEPSDTRLNHLSVSHGTLSPAFHPDTLRYTVEVDDTVSSIYLKAEANNLNATVAGANAEKTLSPGANLFSIRVTAAEPIFRKTYNVTVNRKEPAGIGYPAAAVDVYPNPTTGKVYVENAGGAEIRVYNLPGELLLRTGQNSVDLSGYPKGVYLLQVDGQSRKIVKQ
ncbi:MAG: M6 family metalloprotease domain-containing protein [Dysgonamonadaceae bacterium]|jgi:M6 family metalloprotease-like protein|nr:M6 family metalloprotease domain-containing protein [Dysgonamonadaceae bacterium]